ncbi:MAG: hypothetical protein J7L08_01855, partial [Candidatus Aenigmarchaeota archaeon]|nr:hypothetical protein [Candidatus Aenigmarchaeota archaeon]
TIPSSCHKGSPGSWSYCSDTCKCNAGEGDCDYTGTDRQCVAGTVCVKDVGAKYGWSSRIDVCEAVSTGSIIADASDFIANSWRSLFG